MGWSLFGFNIGLEAGQIVVVTGILILGYLAVNVAGLKRKWWVWGLSAIGLIKGILIAWEHYPAS